MANMRRAKASARGRKARLGREALRETVFGLADTMEQSLRRASHIVFVLTLIDTRNDDVSEPIAFVASEAHDRLGEACSTLNRLFRVLGP